LFFLGGVFLVALAAPPARAQDYPTRPITIVVPFTPGGTTDILARMIGQRLEARLGQSFLIENKPGAGSVIGANAVAKAVPDGYTLLMATSTSMAVDVTLYKNLPYNPASDLIPLALVARTPFVLVVNPSLPVRSVQDLIKLAKDRPGQLSYASAGPGTPHHLYAELLKRMTGIEMAHVPYRGSQPSLNDVVAGHVQLMFVDVAPAVGMLRAGKIRQLGVSNCPSPCRATKNSRRWRDAPIDTKCNFDRRIVVVCCPELERVRPVIVRGSTAPPAQVHQ
jgi:tripartite-type tricarboxylate transporter receptor subunit TctC